MWARMARSAPAGWRRRTARWMSRCWRRISSPSTVGADARDQVRLQHLEDPVREGQQQLVAGGAGEDLVEALVGLVERRRAGRDAAPRRRSPPAARRPSPRRRWRRPGPASGTSRNIRASSSSHSDTVSVASIIEIDSLTLRLMPSLGVRATKMPPERPRPTRIRCELASSRRPSRSVGRLTPNSAASSCSVPIRSPGWSPSRSR